MFIYVPSSWPDAWDPRFNWWASLEDAAELHQAFTGHTIYIHTIQCSVVFEGASGVFATRPPGILDGWKCSRGPLLEQHQKPLGARSRPWMRPESQTRWFLKVYLSVIAGIARWKDRDGSRGVVRPWHRQSLSLSNQMNLTGFVEKHVPSSNCTWLEKWTVWLCRWYTYWTWWFPIWKPLSYQRVVSSDSPR